ncbi:MAG: hypothetical protein HPY66_1726 [Firmicutes bacterium]|nr:hypothetical protein [Bacillota bacterium]
MSKRRNTRIIEINTGRGKNPRCKEDKGKMESIVRHSGLFAKPLLFLFGILGFFGMGLKRNNANWVDELPCDSSLSAEDYDNYARRG